MMIESNLANNFFKISTYSIWVFLLFVGIYDLFVVPYRSLVWFVSLFLLVFFYFKTERIPKWIYFFLSAMILFNVFGELFFEFYYIENCVNPPYCASLFYDKLLHFFNPIIICSFIYFLAKPRIKDKQMLILLAITSTLALGASWEIIEYGFDEAFGALMQGVFVIDGESRLFATGMVFDRMSDTIFDLILNTGGCLIFWIINVLHKNKKELKLERTK